jgi:hypothetical protein
MFLLPSDSEYACGVRTLTGNAVAPLCSRTRHQGRRHAKGATNRRPHEVRMQRSHAAHGEALLRVTGCPFGSAAQHGKSHG